jgi:hypothetical protein
MPEASPVDALAGNLTPDSSLAQPSVMQNHPRAARGDFGAATWPFREGHSAATPNVLGETFMDAIRLGDRL